MNGVLLHFTKHEAKGVVEKIFKALKPGGRFCFTVQKGDKDSWTNHKLSQPRYFSYWQRDEITELLENLRFSSVTVTEDFSEERNKKWLHIIAVK